MSGYCRVTVTGPHKWADLALPGTVPVATLMPRIIEVCCPEDESLEPGTWSLTTADGDPVPLDEPLETAGVYDGDVLLLNRQVAPERSRYVDDVRGAVEDQVDETAWIWNSTVTLAFGLVTAAVGPLLVLGLMMWLSPSIGHMGVALLGTVFTLAIMVYAVRRPLMAIAHVLLITACVWGAVALVKTAGLFIEAGPLVMTAFALFGALLVALAGWAIHEIGLAYIAGLSMMALAAAILVTVGIFTDPVQGLRAMALTLAMCVGVLPRTAMVMGGLSGLDYEVSRSGQVATERFEGTYVSSDRLLQGLMIGTGVSAGTILILLAYLREGHPDLLLCGLLSGLLLLRSRLFDRIRHVLPLRIPGVLGVGATGLATVGQYPVFSSWLPLGILLLGMTLAVISGVRLTDVPRASLRRLLNWVEIIVVVAICVAFAWSMGLFDFVAAKAGIA
ncbi:type VII secretion integral membrane protein EccD [Nocardiopsis alba]|uniref:type VII secretion integral membrane protein EccD n=1 Tax=Nocardiopsis alba TaxID=53437 RepID=UPI00047697DF|nr:type VII secretion integral membrane protein EccD [Nocardiopsis alba]